MHGVCLSMSPSAVCHMPLSILIPRGPTLQNAPLMQSVNFKVWSAFSLPTSVVTNFKTKTNLRLMKELKKKIGNSPQSGKKKKKSIEICFLCCVIATCLRTDGPHFWNHWLRLKFWQNLPDRGVWDCNSFCKNYKQICTYVLTQTCAWPGLRQSKELTVYPNFLLH